MKHFQISDCTYNNPDRDRPKSPMCYVKVPLLVPISNKPSRKQTKILQTNINGTKKFY